MAVVTAPGVAEPFDADGQPYSRIGELTPEAGVSTMSKASSSADAADLVAEDFDEFQRAVARRKRG